MRHLFRFGIGKILLFFVEFPSDTHIHMIFAWSLHTMHDLSVIYICNTKPSIVTFNCSYSKICEFHKEKEDS